MDAESEGTAAVAPVLPDATLRAFEFALRMERLTDLMAFINNDQLGMIGEDFEEFAKAFGDPPGYDGLAAERTVEELHGFYYEMEATIRRLDELGKKVWETARNVARWSDPIIRKQWES